VTTTTATATALGPDHEGQGSHGSHGSHAHVSPMRRVMALVRLERTDVAVVVVYGIVVSLLALATPLAVQALVSSITSQALLQPLLVLSVVLAVALLAGGTLRTLQLSVVEMLQRRIFVRLVADLAWRLPRVASSVKETQDTSKLVNRFFDVVTAQKVMASLLLEGMALALELLIGLGILTMYSQLLMAFSVALLLGVVLVVFVLGVGGVQSSIDESYAKHDVAGWLEELVRHPTLFRAEHARRFGLAGADTATRRYLDARGRQFKVLMRQAIGTYVLQAAASVALLGAGGVLVIEGTLTIGQLMAAELIVTAVTYGLIKLHKQLEAAYDLLAAVDKLGALIELDTESDDGVAVGGNGAPLALKARDLVVDGDGPCTFEVAAGESVAFLDPGSSRGSAIVDALLELRSARSGTLEIGGDDIRHLARSSVRTRVRVAREMEVFEGTLADNLRVGRDALRPRDLVAALAMVELEDVLLTDPRGLGLVLVPGSLRLTSSVGRRLMIARAVVGDAGVVIIDGALDGLEPGLARRIVARLKALDSTIIIVTADPDMAAALPRTISLTPGPTTPTTPPTTTPTLPMTTTPLPTAATTTTPTTTKVPAQGGSKKARKRKGGGR